jgi:hypothetical protein
MERPSCVVSILNIHRDGLFQISNKKAFALACKNSSGITSTIYNSRESRNRSIGTYSQHWKGKGGLSSGP